MADDDVPLAALAAKAPAKTLKLDDDTPLASLAKAAPALKKPGPGGPAAKSRPSVSGAKAKAKGPKRKANSSSSSSSSDSSSSSSVVKKKKQAVAKKKAMIKKTQTEENMDDEADNKVKKKTRSIKEDIVAQLLCRWWFSAPYKAEDWPPQQESFYTKKLDEKKFRKVTIQEWEWLPEEDEQGRRKVYELSQFRGLFRNSSGDLIDVRPKDTIPSFNNFMQKDMLVLCDMLISAYENQLKELLAESRYAVEQTAISIKGAMTKIRDIQAKARDNQNR